MPPPPPPPSKKMSEVVMNWVAYSYMYWQWKLTHELIEVHNNPHWSKLMVAHFMGYAQSTASFGQLLTHNLLSVVFRASSQLRTKLQTSTRLSHLHWHHQPCKQASHAYPLSYVYVHTYVMYVAVTHRSTVSSCLPQWQNLRDKVGSTNYRHYQLHGFPTKSLLWSYTYIFIYTAAVCLRTS